MVINNGVLMCYQNGGNLTWNANLTFPITFSKAPIIFGVGYTIEGIAQQYVNDISVSGFSTASGTRNCATNWYFAIGV